MRYFRAAWGERVDPFWTCIIVRGFFVVFLPMSESLIPLWKGEFTAMVCLRNASMSGGNILKHCSAINMLQWW